MLRHTCTLINSGTTTSSLTVRVSPTCCLYTSVISCSCTTNHQLIIVHSLCHSVEIAVSTLGSSMNDGARFVLASFVHVREQIICVDVRARLVRSWFDRSLSCTFAARDLHYFLGIYLSKSVSCSIDSLASSCRLWLLITERERVRQWLR